MSAEVQLSPPAPQTAQHPLRRKKRRSRLLFPVLIFLCSLIPSTLTLMAWSQSRGLMAENPLHAVPYMGAAYAGVQHWYARHAVPVEELRPLAAFPTEWEGRWHETDRNYARFERWFSDHVGLRSLMIRLKNEVDYQLFRSSRRVYFGKDGELYGRNLIDNEQPATEKLLANSASAEAVYQGVRRFAGALQAEGITMVLIAPIQKQYYTRERMPAFAPRVPDESQFIALSRRLAGTPGLHYIDVKRHLDEQRGKLQLFFRQDFHWTDPMAMVVAADTVQRIAALEGSALRWRHAMAIETLPFVGVEARFAARLNPGKSTPEPQLRRTWQERHQNTVADAAATGWEFHTDRLDDPSLLPATCMYGNSFSDSMLRAGLTEHFRQFHKISRALPLEQVPALVRGQCKYLIVQILDIQTGHWSTLAQYQE